MSSTGVTSTESIVIPLPVAITLFVAMIGVFGGCFGTSIWWASSISTKMDVLVSQGKEVALITSVNGSRIMALELWQRQIDAVGSPATTKRIDALERVITDLRDEVVARRNNGK